MKDKPSLIICRTVIGFGSPNKAGKEEAHGAALGDEEVALTRQKLGRSTRRLKSRKRFTGRGMPVKTVRKPSRPEREICRLQKSVPGTGRRVFPAHERRSAGGLGR
ncbi:hypothetical protein [Enterobacter roggenkampii]|uniref:hypothetical protein n=1 Tax=Enterobacter roggenkampii TaxID=1812935 RepID=UPI002473BE89|nr:hypothetical protein [Enterobacter roggenkampii]